MTEKIIIGYETNCETGEVTPIYETEETIDRREEMRQQIEEFHQHMSSVEAKRLSLLNRLGITEDEAKLLLP